MITENENARRVFCLMPSRLIQLASWEDPQLAVACLRPSLDLAILPESAGTDLFDACARPLGLKKSQLITAPDDYISSKKIDFLVDRLKKEPQVADQEFVLVPLSWSAQFNRFARLVTERLQGIHKVSLPKAFAVKPFSKSIMNRSVRELDVPCRMESYLEGVPCEVPKGFLCSTPSDLLVAFRMLTDMGIEKIVLRPVNGVGGVGIVYVSSAEALRLYDFPLGPVLIQEDMSLENGSNNLTLCLTTIPAHMSAEEPIAADGIEIIEQVVIDACNIGSKSIASADPKLVDMVKESAVKILAAFQAETGAVGPTALSFGASNGKPILTSVSSGRLRMDVAVSSLVKRIAPPKSHSFWTWTCIPPSNMDVHAFWSLLQDADLGLCPVGKRGDGQGSLGVLPLIFPTSNPRHPRRHAIILAIGRDNAHTEEMRAKVDAIITTALNDAAMHDDEHDDGKSPGVDFAHADFSQSKRRRIWVSGPRPEYRRVTQRYNMPNRCIPLVRKDIDIIVLPGGHPETQEFAELLANVLGLDAASQIIFTSGKCYNLDDDMDDNIVARLVSVVKEGMAKGEEFTIVPYAVTPNFERWAKSLIELGVPVYGDDLEWVSKYGHKGILHRHIQTPDQPSVLEQLGIKARLAKGWVCTTTDDLLKAYDLIGAPKVVIKPVFGAAGEGILFISSKEELSVYDFPMGQVILEECLDLDTAEDGIVLSPAVHYMQGELVGDGMVDQIMIGTGYAGWRCSVASKSFLNSCVRTAKKLIEGIAPLGPGGFDFLSVHDRPYLSDVNTGRFNGAHTPKLFVDLYAKGQTFYCWKAKPPGDLPCKQFWARLCAKGAAFIPGQSNSGVFPLTYLRELSGLYVAIAKSELECMLLYEKAKSCLKSGPRITTDVLKQPVPSRYSLTLIKNAYAVYGPQPISCKHILIGGTVVTGLLDDDNAASLLESLSSDISSKVIDATGCVVVPGFVDMHVHVTGGGGECGPASRTPEANISEIVNGGMTTVIGVLGTDAVSRSLESVLFKCRALCEEGISAYMWTGSYECPPPTLTGNVRRDVALIDKVIGVGELAISDHRGSQPTTAEIARIAAEARVGGMLSGKCGKVYCHIGPGPGLLEPLFKVVRETDIPIQMFLPTHMDRSEELIQDGAKWIRQGGYCDFTARSVKSRKAIAGFFKDGLPMDHVSVSSDSYGSLPSFDEDGRLLRYRSADTRALHQFLCKMYFEEFIDLEDLLPLMTKNPSDMLKLQKGTIEVGRDADIVLMDHAKLGIKYVFAMGRLVKSPTYTVQSMFAE